MSAVVPNHAAQILQTNEINKGSAGISESAVFYAENLRTNQEKTRRHYTQIGPGFHLSISLANRESAIANKNEK